MAEEASKLEELLKTIAGVGTTAATATNPIALGASLLPAAFGTINAISAYKKAKKIERENVDPGFKFSPYVEKNIGIAQNAFADKGLPGEDRIKTMMDESIANTLSNTAGLSSASDIASVAGSVGANQITTMGNLAIEGARQDQQDMQLLMGANTEGNQEYLRGEDYKMQKYLRNAAAASAYRRAAVGSVENVVKDVSGIGLSYLNANPISFGKKKENTSTGVGTNNAFDLGEMDLDFTKILTNLRNNRFQSKG